MSPRSASHRPRQDSGRRKLNFFGQAIMERMKVGVTE